MFLEEFNLLFNKIEEWALLSSELSETELSELSKIEMLDNDESNKTQVSKIQLSDIFEDKCNNPIKYWIHWFIRDKNLDDFNLPLLRECFNRIPLEFKSSSYRLRSINAEVVSEFSLKNILAYCFELSIVIPEIHRLDFFVIRVPLDIKESVTIFKYKE